MFNSSIAYALAIVAFALSLFAVSRANKSTARLKKLEKQLDELHRRAQEGDTATPMPAAAPKPATDPGSKASVAAPPPDPRAQSAAVAADREPQTEKFGALPPPPPAKPPGPTIVDRAMDSFINNWVIWLGALSLAFGGIFIVQYGLERGFLGPVARVISALAFGGLLILGAEFIRRKDPQASHGVLTVPVALAAGGIASLFAGVVSAHVLYDLTNPLVGFASMALVSMLALSGGLIYGPVLAVIGLLGAFISPFLVASDGPSPLMYLYFLMVLAASLALERWRHWIWLSALAVTGALIWGVLLHWSMPTEPLLAGYSIAVILITLSVPAFGVLPRWPDTGWITWRSFAKISHCYPTVLAVATALAATVIMVATGDDSLTYWQITIIAFVALLAMAVALLRQAQNLDQLAAIFGAGLIATMTLVDLLPDSPRLMLFGVDYDQTVRAYFAFAALCTLAMTLIYLAGSQWRSPASVRPLYWNTLTASLPLLALIILWGKWSATEVLTKGGWLFLFGLLIALLAGMAWLLLRKGKHNTPSADILACGGFLGLGVLFGIALSPEQQIVGFAVLAASAFWIEARFTFRMLGLISLLYTSLTFGRIVLEPGLARAIEGEFLAGPVFIALAAALFYAAAYWATIVKSAARLVQFETAAVAGVGVLLSVLIGRVLDAMGRVPEQTFVGLLVAVWLMLAVVQFKRAELVDTFTLIRKIFGWGYLALSTLAFIAGFVLLDPVFGGFSDRAMGYFPVDSIAITYGLPALVLFVSIWHRSLPALVPRKFGLPIVGILATWVLILEIRRFWHGNSLDANKGILTPELYTYTVVLLVATLACVVAALIRKDATLRKWGLGLVALTAVKVFLWDMAGLQGLGRATAFIALGLTLTGIAWLFQKFTMDKTTDAETEAGARPKPDP